MQADVDRVLLFLTDALGRTDTRDSFTEIMQYAARIVAGTCPSQEVAARRVYKSLSEGRKIFRLFRFIPELRNLTSIKDSDPLIHGLSQAQFLLSSLFYFLDNFIYYLETVKRKSQGDIRPFKFIKNRISLLRICIALGLTSLELRRQLSLGEKPVITPDPQDRTLQLTVRLWHESLRFWLTLHKLHMLSIFQAIPAGKQRVPHPVISDRTKYDLVPGIVGMASAITAFVRKTYLRTVPS